MAGYFLREYAKGTYIIKIFEKLLQILIWRKDIVFPAFQKYICKIIFSIVSILLSSSIIDQVISIISLEIFRLLYHTLFKMGNLSI